MESHKAGFPPFPLLLEIPSGFPHSHRFDYGIYLFKTTRKWLVTDVSGPQRNACPGTLNLRFAPVGMTDLCCFLRG